MMMKALIGILSLVALVAAVEISVDFPEEWNDWKQEFGKDYPDGATELHRYTVWQANKDYIDNHNENLADTLGYTLGLNEYSDLTSTEVNTQLKGAIVPSSPDPAPGIFEATGRSVPSSVDWREKGYVTGVKNQGQCGSCWAFSTTGALEGQHFNATGKLVSLSEQNLVDCSSAEGNLGCEGGWPYWAYQYIITNNGIDTEKSYPYTAETGTCDFKAKDVGATVLTYHNITPSGNEDSLTEAIAAVGPISICIDAGHESFQSYSSGVYYEPECQQYSADHCILAVGYGVKDGKDMYIVKNSWGKSWGMDGYILMSRNRDNNCGVASYATYPVAGKSPVILNSGNSANTIGPFRIELLFAVAVVALYNLL